MSAAGQRGAAKPDSPVQGTLEYVLYRLDDDFPVVYIPEPGYPAAPSVRWGALGLRYAEPGKMGQPNVSIAGTKEDVLNRPGDDIPGLLQPLGGRPASSVAGVERGWCSD